MLSKWSVTVVYCCVVFAHAAKLPTYITKCEKNSPDLNICIAKSANEAIDHLANGNNHIRFPSLRPLKVPYMNVDVGDGLKLNLTDVDIFGLDNIIFEKVKVDFKARKYDFSIHFFNFSVLGTYDISGRILVLPIFGHGPINATFVNSKTKFSFDYDIEQIKGKEYMVPKNPKYTSVPERAYFKLENLFNGNELLSAQMNKFVDENWKDVNGELTPRLDIVIGELVTEILKSFMLRVPFEDMFAKPSLKVEK